MRSVGRDIERLLNDAAARGCCARATSSAVEKALLVRVRAGRVASPYAGMFVSSDLWEGLGARERHLFIARTLASKNAPMLFCCVTAALAYGLSVTTTGTFGTDAGTVCVASSRSNGCRFAGTRRFAVACDRAWTASGLPVTTPARTVFDCARYLSFPDGLAIADSALRQGLLDAASLEALVEEGRGSKGIAKARLVLEHMDGRAESGGESILRARMIELGYAVPELQVCFDNPLNPSSPYRVDLLSRRKDGGCVAIELDGRQKYQDEKMLNGRDALGVLLNERQREAALTACGLEIMRVRWSDLIDDARLRHLMDVYRIPRANAQQSPVLPRH